MDRPEEEARDEVDAEATGAEVEEAAVDLVDRNGDSTTIDDINEEKRSFCDFLKDGWIYFQIPVFCIWRILVFRK